MLAALGDPQTRYPKFHVGGTNGKGSVVATLDALLRARGLRVGRYTSPHLIDFRERIVVGGKPIAEDAVERFVRDWTAEVERLGATFFEATTCMAFDHFARENVDVAIIEVGLGGRLDSTSVIQPLVSGITSISIDHVEYLGNTVEEIAREKAGIFKKDSSAVIGDPREDIRSLLAGLARAAGCHPISVLAEEVSLCDVEVTSSGTSFSLLSRVGSLRRLRTPLVGAHQAMNTSIALRMLELAGSPFHEAAANAATALETVRLPGRFHRSGTIVFDVAHNPGGAEVLAATLAAVNAPRPLVALVAVLKDKDWRRILEILAPQVDRFVLAAPPSVPADRAWRLEEPLAYAQERGWSVESHQDFDEALDNARRNAATTLITGSFHTVGEAMSRLQVPSHDG